MKPIAQTFLISEPDTSIEGIFLTHLNLYFRSKHPSLGVAVQIRTVDNGFPTSSIVSSGSSYKSSPAVRISNDSTLGTTFVFQTPPFLLTNVQYAIVVIPDGGNDQYTIWTGELGGTDVNTDLPIYQNNQLGTLFISSNDLVFTPIITESMKYELFITNFRNQADIYWSVPPAEYMQINEVVGTFALGESVVVSNSILKVARLNIASTAGTFENGENVYQSNGTANVATGVIYSVNATVMKVSGITGTYTTSNTIQGATSAANATVTLALQNVVVTSSSNVVSVPDSALTDLQPDKILFISTPSRSNVNIVRVSSTVNATAITVNTGITFGNNNCIYGRVRGDMALYAALDTYTEYSDEEDIEVILSASRANTTVHFANAENQYIVGLRSGATAVVQSLENIPYDAITPLFNYIAPAQTSIGFFYKGASNATPSVFESNTNYKSLSPNIPNESIDKQRRLLSRSNELIGHSGNSSLVIKSVLKTSNTKTAPFIDPLGTRVVLTHNRVANASQISGYYLTLANTNNSYTDGDIVVQGSATGTVDFANSSFMRVISVLGEFQANATKINVLSDSTVNSTITTSTYYDETMDNGYYAVSRYISKNVILADGQDAEDMVSYLTTFRPSGTNFFVYGKFLNGSDTDTFNSKDWSYMAEDVISSSLTSSKANRNDLIELQFGMPASSMIDANSVTVSSTSNVVTVKDTTFFRNKNYLYVSDPVTYSFNVREIMTVINSVAIQVSSNISFTSINSSAGIIPDLKSQAGAFLFGENNGILRYSTLTDVVYDGYKTFSIKIVPVSNNSVLVPIMKDMRSLALQI